MKFRTATALRANLLLISLSANIAAITYLMVGSLFGLFYGDALPYQESIYMLAFVIVLLLRRYARHAFDSALEGHMVKLTEKDLEALIDLDCPRLWFVQLHLALRGCPCAE